MPDDFLTKWLPLILEGSAARSLTGGKIQAGDRATGLQAESAEKQQQYLTASPEEAAETVH